MSAQLNTNEGKLPNTRPQAPRSILAETADKDSAIGRNNVPYNPGSTSNMVGGRGVESDKKRPAN